MYICSALKEGKCKVNGNCAPRLGGCVHGRPHPADGSNSDNSAGKIGTPCSESDAPCAHHDGPVKCVPVSDG